MISRPFSFVACALLVLLTACGERTSSRTVHEVKTSQTFYPRNDGCTFDGVAGAKVDIEQMHKAKVISDECFAEPTATTTISESSHTLYTDNPGCKVDGVAASTASAEQIVRAKTISDECFSPPTARK